MQTMTFQKAQAGIRVAMFICSVATVVAVLLPLVGVRIGLLFVIPFGLMYLFMYMLRLLDWVGAKQKPPVERVDQGRRAA
jgi:hypothetical protein